VLSPEEKKGEKRTTRRGKIVTKMGKLASSTCTIPFVKNHERDGLPKEKHRFKLGGGGEGCTNASRIYLRGDGFEKTAGDYF